VALVTGAAKVPGIGSAVALQLGRAGTIVVLTDVTPYGAANVADETDRRLAETESGLEHVTELIRKSGGEASFSAVDVRSEVQCAAVINGVVSRYGRLDILVNNATAPHGTGDSDIEGVTSESWEHLMAVNARGTFLMSRCAVQPMRHQRWGRIVNVASIAALRGRVNQSGYGASKAAVLGFTKSLALDVARDGITVNAICPGVILTTRTRSSMLRSGVGAGDVERELAARADRIPVGRLGTPADVAHLVGFLASEESGFITGQVIGIDGGAG
jgi:3-oxoacyl-[acyl-carrier protein] reductase